MNLLPNKTLLLMHKSRATSTAAPKVVQGSADGRKQLLFVSPPPDAPGHGATNFAATPFRTGLQTGAAKRDDWERGDI